MSNVKYYYILTYALLIGSIAAKSKCTSFVTIPKDYEKENPSSSGKCLVKVGFYYIRLLDVSDSTTTITLSMALSLSWIDDRLKFLRNQTVPWKKLPSSCENELWIPDAYIYGVNEVKRMKLTEKFHYIHSTNNHSLVYTNAFEVSLFCKMNFKSYPFDKQRCDVNLTSYSNNKEEVIFQLEKVNFLDRHQMSRMEFNREVKPFDDYDEEFIRSDGKIMKWSVVGFSIHLMRKPMKILIDYFIPSGLLVIVSWVIISNRLVHILPKVLISLSYQFSDQFCYTTRSCTWTNDTINNFALMPC